MPPAPPPTAEEQAQSARISAHLRELTVIFHQRNLDTAVSLAILARAGRLPKELEEHFGELGRRYAELARKGGVKKAPSLRLVAQNGSEVGA
jgi:hypothetical protein